MTNISINENGEGEEYLHDVLIRAWFYQRDGRTFGVLDIMFPASEGFYLDELEAEISEDEKSLLRLAPRKQGKDIPQDWYTEIQYEIFTPILSKKITPYKQHIFAKGNIYKIIDVRNQITFRTIRDIDIISPKKYNRTNRCLDFENIPDYYPSNSEDIENIPEKIGSYRLVKRLGSGATGEAWKSEGDTGELFAIKLFYTECEKDSCQKEFDIMKLVYGSTSSISRFMPKPIELLPFDEQSRFALVMEYIEGSSLESILRSSETISLDSLTKLSDQIFVAIEAFHPPIERLKELKEKAEGDFSLLHYEELIRLRDSGFLHRDIKPDNIIIKSQETWEPCIIDFGLVIPAGKASKTRVGTGEYLPPDWGVKSWDPSFDLYALGKIFWRCLYGKFVDYREIKTFLKKRIEKENCLDVVNEFFQKALAPSSFQRFHSTKEMREEWASSINALFQSKEEN